MAFFGPLEMAVNRLKALVPGAGIEPARPEGRQILSHL